MSLRPSLKGDKAGRGVESAAPVVSRTLGRISEPQAHSKSYQSIQVSTRVTKLEDPFERGVDFYFNLLLKNTHTHPVLMLHS